MEFLTAAIYILLAVAFPRHRLAMLCLVGALVFTECYFLLNGFVGYESFRGAAFYVVASFLFAQNGQLRIHGLLAGVSVIIFTLVAVEDWLYSLGVNSSIVYDHYEAAINGVIFCHCVLCFDVHISRFGNMLTDNLERFFTNSVFERVQ